MKRELFGATVLFALGLGLAQPGAAEEIAMKDGTKIVGHMTALLGDKIEVETAYGKMTLKRSEILNINFPENGGSAPATTASGSKDVLNIDDSLQGTQYVNRTGKFTLTLPPDWKISTNIGHTAPAIAGLSSRDNMRFLIVSREEYTGSIESFKGIGEIQARRALGNYEELLETPVTIDGKAGLMISYRGTLAKAQNLPVQFLVAIIPSGTTYTKIAAWCVEPLFHEMQPAFEKILASYHSTASAAALEVGK